MQSRKKKLPAKNGVLWLILFFLIPQSYAQVCNWWGTNYPLCQSTSSGWGWENNQSCISGTTCNTQPAPYGVVGAAQSSSNAVASASAFSSSVTSSSTAENCQDICRWYQDVTRPLCENIQIGWGWENSRSCIGRSTCEGQSNGSGVMSICENDKSSSSTQSQLSSSRSSASSEILCAAQTITPYLQINNGAWQQAASASILAGDTIKLGPHPVRGGSWSWQGCGIASNNREQIIAPLESCRAVGTYTNDCGASSKFEFLIAVAASHSSSSYSSASSSSNEGYREGEHILGMDISYWSEQLDRGATYIDTDGQKKDLLLLFKQHGINFIRLRTFVDPTSPYGYASTAGNCPGKPSAYNGIADVVRTAGKIKNAGMGLLLDFHYSDTWADPGKQVIPYAWQNANSIQELAEKVRHYTVDVLQALDAENALPDMVQIGNEITPGMLLHQATNSTDCWGNNSLWRNAANGSASNTNWGNLATLLKAGIAGVKEVDPNIKTLLHIENLDDPSGVQWWVDSALREGVPFDVLAFSAYEEFQGPASAWRSTIQNLSSRYPGLAFVIAEYNPRARLLNDIMREVPNGRGLGTFFWEPTEAGFWGNAIFTQQGNSYQANTADFSEYDKIVEDYELRKIP